MNNQSNFQQEDTDFSAFRASDWTAMQVLLDAEETKKPFLFWLFGGLSIAAILVYFLFLNAIPQVETPKIAAKSAIMPVDVCTENGDFSRNKRTTAAQVERRAAFVFSNNKQTRNEESENTRSRNITNANITNANAKDENTKNDIAKTNKKENMASEKPQTDIATIEIIKIENGDASIIAQSKKTEDTLTIHAVSIASLPVFAPVFLSKNGQNDSLKKEIPFINESTKHRQNGFRIDVFAGGICKVDAVESTVFMPQLGFSAAYLFDNHHFISLQPTYQASVYTNTFYTKTFNTSNSTATFLDNTNGGINIGALQVDSSHLDLTYYKQITSHFVSIPLAFGYKTHKNEFLIGINNTFKIGETLQSQETLRVTTAEYAAQRAALYPHDAQYAMALQIGYNYQFSRYFGLKTTLESPFLQEKAAQTNHGFQGNWAVGAALSYRIF